MSRDERQAAFQRRVRNAWLAAQVARRLGKKRPSQLDRLFLCVVLGLARRREPGTDFMRDEIVDAGAEFDPRELEAYSRGTRASRGGRDAGT